MTLETLIGEKAILTLLTVERWPVVDHLGVNLKAKNTFKRPKRMKHDRNTHFDLVNPLHVIT